LPGAITGVVRDYTISLKCPGPYFKDLSDVEVVMASWVSDWYFENGFDINGVEFGHREAELVKEIENDNGSGQYRNYRNIQSRRHCKKSGHFTIQRVGNIQRLVIPEMILNYKAVNMWLFSHIPERKICIFWTV